MRKSKFLKMLCMSVFILGSLFELSAVGSVITWEGLPILKKIPYTTVQYVSVMLSYKLKSASFECGDKIVSFTMLDDMQLTVDNLQENKILCVLEDKETGNILDAVCFIPYSTYWDSFIKISKDAFVMEVADGNGEFHLLYGGTASKELRIADFNGKFLYTGSFDSSEYYKDKEAPFYFWDMVTEHLMVFFPDTGKVIDSLKTIKTPMFVYDSETRGQEYRPLYVIEFDYETREANYKNRYKCEKGKYKFAPKE